jgi:hypothetical protein
MSRWTPYFTPAAIAKALIGQLPKAAPRSVVDICAGTGGLLAECHQRWRRSYVVGNDLYRTAGPSFCSEWTRRDGRRFALSCIEGDRYFDLVVANPPFGKVVPFHGAGSLANGPATSLLASRRLECSMTTAAALLVGDGGTMASVVPDTLITGANSRAFQKWLHAQFESIEVDEVPRRAFRRMDLGLVLVRAHRKRPGIEKTSTRVEVTRTLTAISDGPLKE